MDRRAVLVLLEMEAGGEYWRSSDVEGDLHAYPASADDWLAQLKIEGARLEHWRHPEKAGHAKENGGS